MDKAAVKRGKYAVISDDDMAIIKRAVLEDRANSSDIVKKQLVDSKISPRTMRSIVAKIKRGVAVRAGAKRAPGGGRKFNPELVKKVQEMKNPDGETISSNVRAIARSLKAPYTQVRRICESHFKNVSKAKGARMSSKNQEDRANFSKEISAMMNKKKNPLKLEDLWFSDEKMFTSMPKNQGARNGRVLIPKGKKKCDIQSKYMVRGCPSHCVQVMVGWCISLQGRIQPYFLPKSTTIDADHYRDRMLAECYYPQIKLAAGARKFVFQQDRARPHFTPENCKWLDRHMKGWLKIWPNKGADMCPLDYGCWSIIQEKVWADGCLTLLELRASILKHIAEMPDDAIHNCIRAFPKRVAACNDAEGSYFELKLKMEKKKEQ